MADMITLSCKRFKRFNKRFGKEKYPYKYGMAFSLFFDIFRITPNDHPIRSIVKCDKEEAMQYIHKHVVFIEGFPVDILEKQTSI